MIIAVFIDFLSGRNEKRRIEREETIRQKEKLEQERNKRREELKNRISKHEQITYSVMKLITNYYQY